MYAETHFTIERMDTSTIVKRFAKCELQATHGDNTHILRTLGTLVHREYSWDKNGAQRGTNNKLHNYTSYCSTCQLQTNPQRQGVIAT